MQSLFQGLSLLYLTETIHEPLHFLREASHLNKFILAHSLQESRLYSYQFVPFLAILREFLNLLHVVQGIHLQELPRQTAGLRVSGPLSSPFK